MLFWPDTQYTDVPFYSSPHQIPPLKYKVYVLEHESPTGGDDDKGDDGENNSKFIHPFVAHKGVYFEPEDKGLPFRIDVETALHHEQ